MLSVTDINNMFGNASVFDQILSIWDVSSITTAYSILYYAKAFKQVLCWDMSRVELANSIFE